MERAIVILQSERLLIFRCQKGRLTLEKIFPLEIFPGNEKDSLNNLAQYLTDHSSLVYILIFDLPEEECHLEDMPQAGFRDRSAIVQRMVKKYFSSALLSAVRSVQSESKKRNRARSGILISGIDSHHNCEQVLEVFEKSQVALQSIHSPITLASSLCKLVSASMGSKLIVLAVGCQCFRILGCVDQCVVFSRYVDLSARDKKKVPSALVGSIQETLTYLIRQNSHWSGSSVTIISEFETTDFSATGFNSDQMTVLSPLAVGGIRNLLPKSRAIISPDIRSGARVEALLASVSTVIAGFTRSNDYTGKIHKRYYLQRKYRQLLTAGALSLTGGAISFAAVATKVGNEVDVLIESYSESGAATRNINSVPDHFDDYSVEAVRQTLVTARLIELRSEQSPVDFLMQVSEARHGAESMSVSSVDWHSTDQINQNSLLEISTQPQGFDRVMVEKIYAATVSGEIEGDVESALDTFGTFVDKLRSISADSSVVVVDAPFDLDQNSTTTADGVSEASGRFTLEISSSAKVQ